MYERKHIEKLFDLMDRMQTGFIDMKQYTTGMQTLGICTYNEFPERTDDGINIINHLSSTLFYKIRRIVFFFVILFIF